MRHPDPDRQGLHDPRRQPTSPTPPTPPTPGPAASTLGAVDLANCDREPIHLPGSIQPHGILLAFDAAGRLTHSSRNAVSVLAQLPPLGAVPSAAALANSAALRNALAAMLEDSAAAANLTGDVPPLSIEADFDGALHDVVLHARAGRVIVEAERRDVQVAELASFALLAHRSMVRLRAGTVIDSILVDAVAAVHQLTGFDRVMAYRFHADDSGEVVAEVADAALDSYLGRRFPAADIPAQARRLYTVNTLRLIANVADGQVPIDACTGAFPGASTGPTAALDLSHALLRSVSPIHIEYLKNIRVAASMSLSLVVGGRLWGLIACHHRSALRVPYALRMACDVLAQVVAFRVQLLTDAASAARRVAAAELSAKLAELAAQDEALPVPLRPCAADFERAISSDALILARAHTRVAVSASAGAAEPTSESASDHAHAHDKAAAELLSWLDGQPEDLLVLNDLAALPAALRAAVLPARSLLAMRFDPFDRGWVVLLRNDQNAGVTWSGPPAKVARLVKLAQGERGWQEGQEGQEWVKVGPLGARLTPAGSLAEWRQEAQGVAVRWDDLDISIARQMLDVVTRASAARAVATDRARTHLLAILGHDLRDPLHAIGMAAAQLSRTDAAPIAHLGARITASTARMARLIGQVLDMSRLRGGLGLGLRFVRTDLAQLLRGLIAESLAVHPNALIHAELAAPLYADIDPDRFLQVLSNLLGNARQHGLTGAPITVRLLRCEAPASAANVTDCAVIEIFNRADAIPAAIVAGLFDPLKRGSLAKLRNPGGLGLGLYIASEAIKGHHGSIGYRHEGDWVVFSVSVPLAQPQPQPR